MATTEAELEAPQVDKLTLLALTAMVVGSMVGAGVFSLPRRFARRPSSRHDPPRAGQGRALFSPR